MIIKLPKSNIIAKKVANVSFCLCKKWPNQKYFCFQKFWPNPSKDFCPDNIFCFIGAQFYKDFTTVIYNCTFQL